MSKIMRMCQAGAAAIGLALGGGAPARAAEAPDEPVAPAAVAAAADPMGLEPLTAEVLATKRGGTEVQNDMLLQGQVAENQAVNVSTGANYITEGSFANAGGVPMVVQNTGNNVLIQNATILNVQVK
ncbi:hypothetical protein CLD22_23845 [Rubrivivax gelatinosus]|nr:hypothetical protein [Rubrivivax gelatinosus]